MDLDTLLQPLGWRDFERCYFRQQPLVLPGDADRFAHLVTADRLNTTLNTHRFTPKRLSFVKAGVSAPRESYLWNFKEEDALVRSDGVQRLIDAGYHLVLNGADEIWPDVRDIGEAWESVTGTYVAVNLYAVWKGRQGFRAHVDMHDTVLVQVSGHKLWSVYEPETVLEPTLDEQPTRPCLVRMLSPGDLLYIPRGWGHAGRTERGHSIHLTAGLAGDPTSLFLRWCIREWKQRPWAYEQLPWPATAERIDIFLNKLTETLRHELSPECFARFRHWKDTSTPVRPSVSCGDMFIATPLSPTSRIRWHSLAQISDTSENEMASLTIDERTVPVPAPIVSAVRQLRTWPPITWQELALSAQSTQSVSLLESWITAMMFGGHIIVEAAR